MKYLLEDLMELAVCQIRHDMKQIRDIMRWCDANYMKVACGIIGLPLLILVVLEVICWVTLTYQNMRLTELASFM